MASKRPPSRGTRWQSAVAEAREALDEIQGIVDNRLADALSDIRDVQSEYQEWRDNMPEGLDQSPVAEKLDAVTEIDLDIGGDLDELSSVSDALDEAENADLPLGFGRD